MLAGGAGCAMAQQPMDQAQLVQMLMQKFGGGNGLPGQLPTQQAPSAASSVAKMSEADLAGKLGAWKTANGPFEVEGFRDGFSVAGERVLDPEGMIMKFAVDRATGDTAYLVEVGPNQYLLKLMRHQAGAPVTVASAYRQQGVWTVETATGVKVAGGTMSLTPRGFMISRENALFHYVAGSGLKSFGLPEGYLFAAHQNGSVSATGWLLLEKRAETKQAQGNMFTKALAGTGLGQVVDSVKQLGATVGVTQADADFALYQLETKKTLPIRIALGDKQTNILSRCHARNTWVNQCDRLDSIESLYGQDGAPNRQHYYWRLAWFQTERGPIALTMEDNISKIEVVDLGTERRATVFSRAMGIAGWTVKQQPDGRVTASAQLGFNQETVDDVSKLLEAPAVAVSQNAPVEPPSRQ